MRKASTATPNTWPAVAWATLLRDMWIAISYPLGFVLTTGGSIFNIVGIFFLGRAFGSSLVASVERYGGSYFAFAVIGVALTTFMGVGLTGTAVRIREGQMLGTLELMLLSPNRLGVILVSSSLWSHVLATITLLLSMIVGVALGMDLGKANVPMALLSLVLATVAFNALGFIAASVVIVIKQGSPVTVILAMASALAGGVLYPTAVLPGWLQAVGQLLPLTHALELIRRSVLMGEGIDTLWGPFLSLTFLTAGMLPLGLWACHEAVRLAQTDGSLSQY